jgi:hypothetical protein
MAMGKVLRARQLIFGTLPINLLDRSSLSPHARLLWAVLDSCGSQEVRPSIEFLAIRMGLDPKSRPTVYRALDELCSSGFLEVDSSRGGKGTNAYYLKLPDYCLVDTPAVLEAAFNAPVPVNALGWTGAKGRVKKKSGFDRAAWILGRAQDKLARAAQVQLALGDQDAAAADQVQAPAAAAPVAAPAAPLDPAAAPAGWEGYAAAYEAKHRRPFFWSKTTQTTAARIHKQLGPELTPGTWAAFLADDFWAGKRHPFAALAKAWAEYVPAKAALPTCRHSKTTEGTERASYHGRPGVWISRTCQDCARQVSRDFIADPTPEEAAQAAAFMAKLRAKGLTLGAS